MKVYFSFSQTLQTIHPFTEVEVWFSGEALVTEGEGVQIYRVFNSKESGGYELSIPKGYLEQQNTPGEMGRFLGKCREAARKEWAINKSLEPRNGGFFPYASDIKYMNNNE